MIIYVLVVQSLYREALLDQQPEPANRNIKSQGQPNPRIFTMTTLVYNSTMEDHYTLVAKKDGIGKYSTVVLYIIKT